MHRYGVRAHRALILAAVVSFVLPVDASMSSWFSPPPTVEDTAAVEAAARRLHRELTLMNASLHAALDELNVTKHEKQKAEAKVEEEVDAARDQAAQEVAAARRAADARLVVALEAARQAAAEELAVMRRLNEEQHAMAIAELRRELELQLVEERRNADEAIAAARQGQRARPGGGQSRPWTRPLRALVGRDATLSRESPTTERRPGVVAALRRAWRRLVCALISPGKCNAPGP